jgi:hypothetical protein
MRMLEDTFCTIEQFDFNHRPFNHLLFHYFIEFHSKDALDLIIIKRNLELV